MKLPADLKYTKEHEWVKETEEGVLIVGITDYAQDELGDIVYLDIDSEGESLEADEVFGTIEAVKTVSDLYMPVSGTIEELNPQLEDQPELVNSDPYEKGWLVKIKPDNISDVADLLSAEEYQKMVQS